MTTDPHGSPLRVTELATWLTNQASLRAYRLLAERLAAVDAHHYHFRLLAALERSGPVSQAELGRRTGIDRSDVVAALNTLTAGRQVQRSVDPADRRRNIVTLTDAGTARLRELDKVIDAVQDEFLAPLDQSQRDQLISLLTSLLSFPGGSCAPDPVTPV